MRGLDDIRLWEAPHRFIVELGNVGVVIVGEGGDDRNRRRPSRSNLLAPDLVNKWPKRSAPGFVVYTVGPAISEERLPLVPHDELVVSGVIRAPVGQEGGLLSSYSQKRIATAHDVRGREDGREASVADNATGDETGECAHEDVVFLADEHFRSCCSSSSKHKKLTPCCTDAGAECGVFVGASNGDGRVSAC